MVIISKYGLIFEVQETARILFRGHSSTHNTPTLLPAAFLLAGGCDLGSWEAAILSLSPYMTPGRSQLQEVPVLRGGWWSGKARLQSGTVCSRALPNLKGVCGLEIKV